MSLPSAILRMDKVGGGREIDSVSCYIYICLSKEKKVRYIRREVMFNSRKGKRNALYIAEDNLEKIRQYSYIQG